MSLVPYVSMCRTGSRVSTSQHFVYELRSVGQYSPGIRIVMSYHRGFDLWFFYVLMGVGFKSLLIEGRVLGPFFVNNLQLLVSRVVVGSLVSLLQIPGKLL